MFWLTPQHNCSSPGIGQHSSRRARVSTCVRGNELGKTTAVSSSFQLCPITTNSFGKVCLHGDVRMHWRDLELDEHSQGHDRGVEQNTAVLRHFPHRTTQCGSVVHWPLVRCTLTYQSVRDLGREISPRQLAVPVLGTCISTEQRTTRFETSRDAEITD